jgi:hypothetical protein
MTNIILCGNLSDASVSGALLPALENYGGLRYYGPDRIFERGNSPEFFLYDCGEAPEIGLKSGIILFKNSLQPQKAIHIPSGFLCVLETKNYHAASLLKDTDAAVVTCGTSTKDTLSIASLENDSAVLSLQRSLKTLKGETLEPHDFTVGFSEKRSPHQLLSVCAALLISGLDSSAGYAV